MMGFKGIILLIMILLVLCVSEQWWDLKEGLAATMAPQLGALANNDGI